MLRTRATLIWNRPYVIDLQSTNGTHVNGLPIPPSRFYELKPGDGTALLLLSGQTLISRSASDPVIKFGTSAREYVLLHDEAV